MVRVLFVATLHHPEQLLKEQAAHPDEPRLFPTSMGQHFWEKAMRNRGYSVDVFWRNLPGYGEQTIERLRSQVHSESITPQKVAQAVMNRMPPRSNPDIRRRNANLIEHARRFLPDVIWLVGDNTVIYGETLAQIKAELSCDVIYATGTSPIVFSHRIERQAARLYDLVLVNDYYHGIQWLELGAKRMECLPIAAIDPDFHHPYDLTDEEREATRANVTFVGTLVPDNLYSERVAALEAITEFKPGIWSVHDVPQSLKPFKRGYALGGDMMRVLSNATISLNVHGDFMRYGGNMRLFEAAAVGAFQITDDRPGIREWFTPDEHLVTFRNHTDLRQKIAHYLAHPEERQRMVDAARAHVLAHHTYTHRLAKVESLLKR